MISQADKKHLAPLALTGLVITLVVIFFLGISNVLQKNIYTMFRLSDNYYIYFPSLAVMVSAVVALIILGFAVNANWVSPHYFYRDRLAEAYLMTYADKQRKEKYSHQGETLTNIRDDSERKLHELYDDNHAGPYHLIVTAINLAGSRELKRRTMLSDHFIFSRNYVGSRTTGFVKTEVYRDGKTKLARAMTISGAAAASAAGLYTSFWWSFLLTLFNARLGFWIDNPWNYRPKSDQDSKPRKPYDGGRTTFWLYYLACEMLGKTDAKRELVNLSDGGHTGDNLGLLPLLRRGCGLIVVCDGEKDKDYTFDSFSNAVRMARVEENLTIDIDMSEIIPPDKPGADDIRLSKTSVAIGDIRYYNKKNPSDYKPGKLVYIKASLSDNPNSTNLNNTFEKLPIHVANYARHHTDFPHQSTIDQFFDDSQFESYRALGEHLGYQAVSKIKNDLATAIGTKGTATSPTTLFDNLVKVLSTLPAQNP